MQTFEFSSFLFLDSMKLFHKLNNKEEFLLGYPPEYFLLYSPKMIEIVHFVLSVGHKSKLVNTFKWKLFFKSRIMHVHNEKLLYLYIK